MLNSKINEVKGLINDNYIQQAKDELDNANGIVMNAIDALQNYKGKIEGQVDPELVDWIDGFISEYLS